jgi:hypothetical protein
VNVPGPYIIYTNLAFLCPSDNVRSQTFNQTLHFKQFSTNSTERYSDEQQVTTPTPTVALPTKSVCYNSKVIVSLFLQRGDRVYIEAGSSGSVVERKDGRSYFGMYMVHR